MRTFRHVTKRQPSNPWGEKNVLWRDMIDPDDDSYAEFHKLIANPDRSHIVREVQVIASFLPNRTPRTVSEAEDAIAMGDQEFNRLRAMGIEIARADWHIIKAGRYISTILARVPIVDGQHVQDFSDDHLPTEEQRRIETLVKLYKQGHKSDEPYLNDVSGTHQYVYGTYRFPTETELGLAQQAIMVDPDLIFKQN